MPRLPEPIPPGEEGLISIIVKTRGKGGATLNKKVTVITNDPKKKEIPLSIKGYVEEIYTLSLKDTDSKKSDDKPKNAAAVTLKGIQGEAIKQTLSLVPGDAFPFALKEIRAKKGQNIKYQFEEIKDENSVRYEVTIENTRTDAGIYFDTLYLKTDSKRKPEIQISIFGNIGKAPAQPAQKPVG